MHARTQNRTSHDSTGAGLTLLSQSAIYQPMALTDGPHAPANSQPLVSHTSTPGRRARFGTERRFIYGGLCEAVIWLRSSGSTSSSEPSRHLDNHRSLPQTSTSSLVWLGLRPLARLFYLPVKPEKQSAAFHHFSLTVSLIS